jgi:hypothetical protein
MLKELIVGIVHPSIRGLLAWSGTSMAVPVVAGFIARII